MPKKISEHDIQRAVCIHLDAHAAPGVVYWHTPNGGARDGREGMRFKQIGVKAGIPDLLFLHQGRLFGLELKSEGETPTQVQLDMCDRLRSAGLAAWGMCDNLATAKAWLCANRLTVNGC